MTLETMIDDYEAAIAAASGDGAAATSGALLCCMADCIADEWRETHGAALEGMEFPQPIAAEGGMASVAPFDPAINGDFLEAHQANVDMLRDALA